ncbi:MAG TPA: hypothetical protein QF564_15205 [Pirellulaceae bacterium]|nr:hypothetical protein [Pirellulaceae bacterium]
MVLGLFRQRAARPRRRIPLVFLIGIVLVGLVWFAPTIAVNSSLKSTILKQATEGFEGKISTGYISAGWFSSIVVNDVVAQDKQGEPILLASTARTKNTLLSLIIDPTNVGVIRIDQPKLNLVLKENTSNLEDAIRPLLTQPASDSGPVNITIEFVDGTVTAFDGPTGRKWNAEGINVTLTSHGADAKTIVHFEANVTGSDAQPGSLVADVMWQQSTDGSSAALGSGNLTAEVRRFDLSVLESLLRRGAPGINLTGTLGGDVRIDWGARGETANLSAITVEQLQLIAPQWLGPDRVALQGISLQGLISRQDDTWKVTDLAVASDVISLRAEGQGATRVSPLEDLSAVLADVWQRGAYQVAGNVDVARLAQMLPSTLRIRESVELTSGRVSGSLTAQQGNEGSQWRTLVTASDLAGTHDGLPIRFDEPVEIAFTARQSGREYIVDQLDCHASFFRLNARGTQQQGTLAAECDLTQFFKEVSRFVDVGDLGLAGRLQTDVQWNQVAPGQVALQATAEATNFELTRGDQPPWREAQMRIDIAATGTLDEAGGRGLQQASLRVESAGDVLLAELLRPVASLSTNTPLPLRAQLQGELRSWRTRARPWLPAVDVSLDGIVDATVQGTGSPHLVEIDAADIRVRQFNLVGAGLNIREPEVQLKTQAVLNLDEMEFVTTRATYTSSSLSFQAEDVRFKSSPAQFEISGNAGYRADLAQLTRWFAGPNQALTQQFSGDAVGQIRMTHQAGLTTADVQADISKFAYATPVEPIGSKADQTVVAAPTASANWNTLWNEPVLKVAGLIGYVHADQTVRLDKIEISGDAVSLGARGQVSDPLGRCYLDVEGQVGYDLERVTRKLRPQLGDHVQLKGRDAKPFKVRGPLLSVTETPVSTRDVSSTAVPQPAASILTELMAQGSLAWTAAEIQGFTIGPGQIETEMADGIATARMLQVPLAEGTLRLTPRLLMNRSPMVLQLAHGSGAENVRITKEMCQSWLKYVAPLVADATAAEGTFSVRLDGASVPLDVPQSADIKGKLIVHQAHIGPGPLARELLLVANQIRALAEGQPLGAIGSAAGTWLELPDQEIDFKLLDNRIHHQGLEMRVKDVVIRTRGSVGTDQSLSMVAEIPIRDQWLSSSRYLASLKGQSLRIPIQGTLSKPRLERSALEQLTRQTLTNAASGLIEQELNRGIGRGLEKLFGPQQ